MCFCGILEWRKYKCEHLPLNFKVLVRTAVFGLGVSTAERKKSLETRRSRAAHNKANPQPERLRRRANEPIPSSSSDIDSASRLSGTLAQTVWFECIRGDTCRHVRASQEHALNYSTIVQCRKKMGAGGAKQGDVSLPSSSDMSRNSFMVSGTLILCFSDALCQHEGEGKTVSNPNSQRNVAKSHDYLFGFV